MAYGYRDRDYFIAKLQRGITAAPLASDRWIVVVALGDILSNRSRGVLPRKFIAF